MSDKPSTVKLLGQNSSVKSKVSVKVKNDQDSDSSEEPTDIDEGSTKFAFEEFDDSPQSEFDYAEHIKKAVKTTRLSLSTSDRATKRVIAPYVRVLRRSDRLPKEIDEGKQFLLYMQKKPTYMRDLSTFLSDSISLMSTLYETAEVVKEVLSAVGATLYIADEAADEICQCPRNVVSDRHRVTWKIEEGGTIAAYCASSKEYVMVDEVLGDVRFLDGAGYQDETVKSVLCLPILNPHNECLAVLELYRDVKQPNFGQQDLKTALLVTSWAGTAIFQNQERLALQKREQLNDYLLHLVKCYFSERISIETFIIEVVVFAKDIFAAGRGFFYILNKDGNSIEADAFEETYDGVETKIQKKNTRIKLEPDSVLGIVANTGETININVAFGDPRYNTEQDEKNGIITTTLICMPVMGIKVPLGLVQLSNKKDSVCFTSTDEHLLKLLSLYCALALHYFKLRTKLFKTEKMNECYIDIIKYHIPPCSHDLDLFLEKLETNLPQDFDNLTWYITTDFDCYMPQYTMSMMLRVVGEQHINKPEMMKFILATRRLYRDNPYHNFQHGFSVCHVVYSILLLNFDTFTLLERQAFMVATLCHDIDHPGFTNNFLRSSDDYLSQLYDSSYLENYHYYLTMILLQEMKIFETMSCCEFREFTKEIEHMILITDLCLHMECRKSLTQIQATFEWDNSQHRKLLKEVIMTLCDLAAQCTPYLTAIRMTNELYREFYNEGDILKTMGLYPYSLMDRDKQDSVAEDQVMFLSVIVIPCSELVMSLLPNIEPLVTEAKNNRDVWREQIKLRGQKVWRRGDSTVN